MQRIKCTVAYDGTNFYGYQVQPNKRTVQSEIECALQKMHKGNHIPITASGRTDRGVHAMGQVFHFDSTLTIPPDRWQKALNAIVPDDIVIKSCEYVDASFHARYDVLKKTYVYRVMRKEPDVFRRHYAYYFPYPLDVGLMNECASHLVGTHDFSSFCAANTSVIDKVRTIYDIRITEVGDEMIFTFTGSGFLYNMVRILVGTLLEIGQEKRPISDVKRALTSDDRTLAGKTAPSYGLYLANVKYKNDQNN